MKFTEVEEKTNQNAIKKMEELFGYKIPNEYIAHLLKFNGGRCEPNIFSFEENGKLTTSDIDWFLALYDGEFDNLFNYLESYKGKLPNYFLPIAHDSGGNLICISCGIENRGYLYFWNHEINEKGEYEFFMIAKSFNDFLTGLK